MTEDAMIAVLRLDTLLKRQRLTLYRTDWGHEASLKQLIKLTRKYNWPIYIEQLREL
jgi:hypothetical protein